MFVIVAGLLYGPDNGFRTDFGEGLPKACYGATQDRSGETGAVGFRNVAAEVDECGILSLCHDIRLDTSVGGIAQ